MPNRTGLNERPSASARLRQPSFSETSVCRIASADSTACLAWSGSSSGAFQNAMIASPMYLSTVPRRIENRVGHRRQIFVEEMGQLRGVEPFRDGRERPDVAEEQGQLALQAAELERARHFRQPRDNRGRDEAPEGGTNFALLMTLDRVEGRDAGKIDRGGGKRGVSRLDEQSGARKGEPARGDDRGNHGCEDERRELRAPRPRSSPPAPRRSRPSPSTPRSGPNPAASAFVRSTIARRSGRGLRRRASRATAGSRRCPRASRRSRQRTRSFP